MVKISEPISVIAHQLKNPLVILKEFLNLLVTEDVGKINDKQKEYLSDALKITGQMEKIISDVLDASKIEGGVYTIKLQSTDLVKIIREILLNFNILAKSFNCEIVFEESSNMPMVNADPNKIKDVIENFVFNALKYKYAGHGTIVLKLAKRGDKVIFSCSDDGIGLLKKDSKKIFSKFYRSEEAMKIDPTGIGLGLYINKAIVEMSKGKIWFERNKEKGSTFYFSLPIVK